MKIKTILIDDEPIALEKLHKYAERISFIETVGTFDNGMEAMEYLVANPVDLIFTDINMPDMNGIDFIKSLPTAPMVIFTTAYDNYAVESYRLSAIDYLLKPYSFDDFRRAANKAFEYHCRMHSEKTHIKDTPSRTDSIFVKVDYRYLRIVPDDISFIKGYGEYLKIYLAESRQPLTTLSSFASIMQKLPDNFLQVHRSYIVNMERAIQIERNRILMDADTVIPVSDGFRDNFQSYLHSHSIGRK